MNKDEWIVLGGAALAGYLGANLSSESTDTEQQQRVTAQLESVKATLEGMVQNVSDRQDAIDRKIADHLNAEDAVKITDYCGLVDNYAVGDKRVGCRLWIKVKNTTSYRLTVTYQQLQFTVGSAKSYVERPMASQICTVLDAGKEQWWNLFGVDNEKLFEVNSLEEAVVDYFGSKKSSYGETIDSTLFVTLAPYADGAAIPVNTGTYQADGKMLCMRYASNRSTGYQELTEAGLLK